MYQLPHNIRLLANGIAMGHRNHILPLLPQFLKTLIFCSVFLRLDVESYVSLFTISTVGFVDLNQAVDSVGGKELCYVIFGAA